MPAVAPPRSTGIRRPSAIATRHRWNPAGDYRQAKDGVSSLRRCRRWRSPSSMAPNRTSARSFLPSNPPRTEIRHPLVLLDFSLISKSVASLNRPPTTPLPSSPRSVSHCNPRDPNAVSTVLWASGTGCSTSTYQKLSWRWTWRGGLGSREAQHCPTARGWPAHKYHPLALWRTEIKGAGVSSVPGVVVPYRPMDAVFCRHSVRPGREPMPWPRACSKDRQPSLRSCASSGPRSLPETAPSRRRSRTVIGQSGSGGGTQPLVRRLSPGAFQAACRAWGHVPLQTPELERLPRA